MEDYYDIESILAGQEQIMGSFRVNAWQLGFLDPSRTPEDDLDREIPVELPMWLAISLFRRNFVELEMPRYLSASMWNELQDQPEMKNIRAKCYYFYRIAVAIARLFDDEHLVESLQELFKIRSDHVSDEAMTAAGGLDINNTMTPFTDVERQLFLSGYEGLKEFENWRRGKNDRLSARPSMEYAMRMRQSSSFLSNIEMR